MSREEARREARQAINAKGGINRFAREAEVDAGTVGDFLSGKRWPQSRTLSKIERGLGWPEGRIEDLAEGRATPGTTQVTASVRVLTVGRDEDDRSVVVYRDADVMPEAIILTEGMRDMTEERRQDYLKMALDLQKAYRQ